MNYLDYFSQSLHCAWSLTGARVLFTRPHGILIVERYLSAFSLLQDSSCDFDRQPVAASKRRFIDFLRSEFLLATILVFLAYIGDSIAKGLLRKVGCFRKPFSVLGFRSGDLYLGTFVVLDAI